MKLRSAGVILLLSLLCAVSSMAHTTARATYLYSMENSLFVSINRARLSAGLPMLQLSADLIDVARYRSSDMAQRGYFSHTSPEGVTFFSILGKYHIPYQWAGEIIARNNYSVYTMSDEAMNSYLSSEQHRAIIMDARYSTVGVGYALGAGGMNYFTAVFVQP